MTDTSVGSCQKYDRDRKRKKNCDHSGSY